MISLNIIQHSYQILLKPAIKDFGKIENTENN